MSERICLYPGSFDPVTLGHTDLIRRASALFDRVMVGVLINVSKRGVFSVEERLSMLSLATEDLKNVEVISFSGLTAELCRQKGVRVLLRGLRGAADLDGELTLAKVNRILLPGLETVFLAPSSGLETVSSSLVREIASFGGDISPFVPAPVLPLIRAKYENV